MLNPLTETGKVRIKSYSNVESFNRSWQGKTLESYYGGYIVFDMDPIDIKVSA